MKIDIIRKVPEDMDCLIIFQDENGRLESVELLPPELAKLIQAYIKRRISNLLMRVWQTLP